MMTLDNGINYDTKLNSNNDDSVVFSSGYPSRLVHPCASFNIIKLFYVVTIMKMKIEISR